MKHQSSDLILLFNTLFGKQFETELVNGSEEPFYKVADADSALNKIYFAHGFFSSALHEIAHWCVAGKERLKHDDYAYWYEPDGRDQLMQNRFYQVECKPQALEWIFSEAARYSFQFSLDNLNDSITGAEKFKLSVRQQVDYYLVNGLPKRAQQFVNALQEFYKTKKLNNNLFKIDSDCYQL